MKVLKKRNGLALLSVLVVLLFLTLLIPVMLNYSYSATKLALNGSEQQKASYLARSGCEMAVAAFKKSYASTELYSEEYRNMFIRLTGKTVEAGTIQVDEDGDGTEETHTITGAGAPLTEINTQTVYLFVEASDETDFSDTLSSYYVTSASELSSMLADTADYEYVGCVDTNITYTDEVHVFKLMKDGTSHDICCDAAYASDFAAACNSNVNNEINASNSDEFSYVKQYYKQFKFKSIARVGESPSASKQTSSERGATVVETTNTKTTGWVMDQTSSVEPRVIGEELKSGTIGINMITVDPTKATSKQYVTYNDKKYGSDVKAPVLVYSAIGNLVVDSAAAYPTKDMLGAMTSSNYNAMVNNMPLYFGTEPGINNADKIAKGCYTDYTNCITFEDAINKSKIYTMNSMVAFAATNAIQCNLKIDLCVNPCRTDTTQRAYQASIFKAVVMQANDIIFKDTVTNFMSFTIVDNWLADGIYSGRRFGSVVLAANSDTPYSYPNQDRGKTVKAGKVVFNKDVYMVIIPYKHNSGKHVALSDEVYDNFQKRIYATGTGLATQVSNAMDGDSGSYARAGEYGIKNYIGVTKYGYYVYKMFNAGDVYYFNAELTDTKDGVEENIGISLVNWWIETYYYDNLENDAKNIFQKGLSLAFGFIKNNFTDKTYVRDDMYFVGNVNDAGTTAPEDLEETVYVIWDS